MRILRPFPWPMHANSRLTEVYDLYGFVMQPSFFWGGRFKNGHGIDVNLRLMMVLEIGDGVEEFAFPLSFLYHLLFSKEWKVGMYASFGLTLYNLVAHDYYLGIGPSVALGVLFGAQKRVRIPVELRYEWLPCTRCTSFDRGGYNCMDFGGMTLAVGISL